MTLVETGVCRDPHGSDAAGRQTCEQGGRSEWVWLSEGAAPLLILAENMVERMTMKMRTISLLLLYTIENKVNRFTQNLVKMCIVLT